MLKKSERTVIILESGHIDNLERQLGLGLDISPLYTQPTIHGKKE